MTKKCTVLYNSKKFIFINYIVAPTKNIKISSDPLSKWWHLNFTDSMGGISLFDVSIGRIYNFSAVYIIKIMIFL